MYLKTNKHSKLSTPMVALFCGDSVMDASGQPTAAWRRRQRRLLSMLRQERQPVAMALAECMHHSAQRPEKTKAGGGGETNHTAAHRTKPPPPPLPRGARHEALQAGRRGQHAGSEERGLTVSLTSGRKRGSGGMEAWAGSSSSTPLCRRGFRRRRRPCVLS